MTDKDSEKAALLRAALQRSEACRDVGWYGVGCVIANSAGEIVATGYTGELRDPDGGQRHAEEVALSKLDGGAAQPGELALYSTLEPCSVRASGKTPCTVRIIQAGIKQVVFGASEPYEPALGIVCRGAAQLAAAGVQVTQLPELADACLASARAGRKRGSAG